MSPIERKSIRIEDEQIIADGSGLDEGKQFLFVGDLANLWIQDDCYLNRKGQWYRFANASKEKRTEGVEINGMRHIEGPSVFDAREMPGRNHHGISISKRRGIAFNPAEFTRGVWKEVLQDV